MPKPAAPRVPRPPRKGQATQQARAPSFRSQTLGVAADTDRATPFDSMDDKRRFAHFKLDSQEDIQTALDVPLIRQTYLTTHSSGSELVLVGYFLKQGWQLGHDLLWQSDTLRDFDPSGRPFVVDVALDRFNLIDILVNGEEFHYATLQQMLHDQQVKARLEGRTSGQRADVLLMDAEIAVDESEMVGWLEAQGVV